MGKLFTTSQKKILAGLLLDRYGSHLEEESIRVDGRSEPGFVELTAVIRMRGARDTAIVQITTSRHIRR